MYRFEKLRVYQHSIDLVEEIYRLTRMLPDDEKYALTDQLKRSSTSIVLNIAEGSGGLGDIEFKSYLRNSLKSLYETAAGLKIAKKLFKVDIDLSIEKCNIVGKELNSLIKSLSNNKHPKTKD